jgi:hypothetical protein
VSRNDIFLYLFNAVAWNVYYTYVFVASGTYCLIRILIHYTIYYPVNYFNIVEIYTFLKSEIKVKILYIASETNFLPGDL